MIKRSLLDKTGGFDEDLTVCEDYDMWLRISRNHVVGLDPSLSVIKYGGHEDQLSKKYNAMDSYRVRALLKALQGENDPCYKRELVRELEKKLTILITGSRKRNKLDKCREYEHILASI